MGLGDHAIQGSRRMDDQSALRRITSEKNPIAGHQTTPPSD
jgi:hypothetical protein